MSKHAHFLIAVTVGVGIQPTAIAVVEQEVLKSHGWLLETGALRLKHLERMPLDASYPDIAARVSTLLETPEIKDGERCGGAQVVIDVTGSGRAILELFERVEIEPVVVTITSAGVREDQVGFNDWRVPKVELIGALRVVYETRRLKMAKDIDLVQTLVSELREFKMRPPRIDPSAPETWRDGQFDDLVFAVALVAWRADRDVPTAQEIRDRYDKMSRRLDTGRKDSWMSN